MGGYLDFHLICSEADAPSAVSKTAVYDPSQLIYHQVHYISVAGGYRFPPCDVLTYFDLYFDRCFTGIP